MNEAVIKKAIEGGWRDDGSVKIISGDIYTFGARIIDSEVVLDPLFWRALGKALGWNKRICMACLREHLTRNDCDAGFGAIEDEWLYHAQTYNYLLLTGGNTEQFWKDLLK